MPQTSQPTTSGTPVSPVTSKKPEQMTVAELKAWLTHRGAPTKGKKSDLLAW